MRVLKPAAVAVTLLVSLAACSSPGAAPDRAPAPEAGKVASEQAGVPASPAPGQGGDSGAAGDAGAGPGPASAQEKPLPPPQEVLADFDAALVKLGGTYVAEAPEGWSGPTYPEQEEEFFAHLAPLVEPAVKEGWREAPSGDKVAAVRAWVREYPATTYNPALMAYMWEMTCVAVENASEDSPLPAAIGDAADDSALSLSIAYTCPALQAAN